MEAQKSGKLPNLEPVALFTDNPEAKAITIAKSYGLEVKIETYSKENREEFQKRLLEYAMSLSPQLVVACGYMKILPPSFVRAFPKKILNIHPSLLPAFPGLHSQKQALEYGAKVSGCTVHFVDEGVDTGPIILQESVVITQDTTLESLSRQILEKEHKILVEAIKLFTEERLYIEGRLVKIRK